MSGFILWVPEKKKNLKVAAKGSLSLKKEI
jgi:hypothetical protein